VLKFKLYSIFLLFFLITGCTLSNESIRLSNIFFTPDGFADPICIINIEDANNECELVHKYPGTYIVLLRMAHPDVNSTELVFTEVEIPIETELVLYNEKYDIIFSNKSRVGKVNYSVLNNGTGVILHLYDVPNSLVGKKIDIKLLLLNSSTLNNHESIYDPLVVLQKVGDK